jgi:predicted nucleic acid-binding protein
MAAEGAAISVLTYGETLDGVLGKKHGQPALNRQRWEQFLQPFDVIGVDVEIAEIWAGVRGALRRRGATTPDTDLLIASTALRFGLTMVTYNRRHFERVEGLSLLVPDPPIEGV